MIELYVYFFAKLLKQLTPDAPALSGAFCDENESSPGRKLGKTTAR
jgi:hypothetical protein